MWRGPAFLATAQSTSSRGNKTRECQAYFYAGSMRLAEGNVAAARMDFARAVKGRQTTLFEYRSSLRALSAASSGGKRAAHLR